MNPINLENVNFSKLQGLIPVCIQDQDTMQVLMVGFMNQEALEETIYTRKVTFYSRTKNKLWIKGETSGNFLEVINIQVDCDQDSLLIYARPVGPTCHTGSISCFNDDQLPPLYWLAYLIEVIKVRQHEGETSYTSKLMASGIKRIAQKVGEEGVEVALAAVANQDEELTNECVDLFYHLFVLLQSKQIPLADIARIIRSRRKNEASISVR